MRVGTQGADHFNLMWHVATCEDKNPISALTVYHFWTVDCHKWTKTWTNENNLWQLCCVMIHTPKFTIVWEMSEVCLNRLWLFISFFAVSNSKLSLSSTVCVECSYECFYSVLQDHQLVCTAWFPLRSHYPKAIYSIDHYQTQRAFLLWLQKNIFTSPEHAYKMLHWTKEEQEWFRPMPLTYGHLWPFSGN